MCVLRAVRPAWRVMLSMGSFVKEYNVNMSSWRDWTRVCHLFSSNRALYVWQSVVGSKASSPDAYTLSYKVFSINLLVEFPLDEYLTKEQETF